MLNYSKEELKEQIEIYRKKLDESIDAREDYERILRNSREVDHWIEQYIVAGN